MRRAPHGQPDPVSDSTKQNPQKLSPATELCTARRDNDHDDDLVYDWIKNKYGDKFKINKRGLMNEANLFFARGFSCPLQLFNRAKKQQTKGRY